MMGYFRQSILLLLAISARHASCAPMGGGIARNVKSDLVFVRRDDHALARFPRRIGDNFDKDVPVGQSLDLFYRFGFFSLSVRVVPRDDAGKWLIREPTVNIFDNAVARSINVGENAFESDFQVYLCDDEAELMDAYFKDFTAEGIEEPYKLYTGSWHATTKAKYLGLDKTAFDGDSSFVLVRLNKRRGVVNSNGAANRVKPDVAKAASALRTTDDVLAFTRRFGSHYVDEVSVGDSIYQVYALQRPQIEALKRSLGRDRQHSFSGAEFRAVADGVLAPWNVREVGRPLAASGDSRVQALLDESGVRDLFSLSDPALVTKLEEATRDTEAVVGLRFASVRRFIPEGPARAVYDTVLRTNAILWEANI